MMRPTISQIRPSANANTSEPSPSSANVSKIVRRRPIKSDKPPRNNSEGISEAAYTANTRLRSSGVRFHRRR